MKNIAIITARGGSKRIPKKNIKEFMGKPMIAYAIETALNSEIFDEVMVSTDNLEIAEVAKKYGAKVPFMRSKKSSDDFSTTVDVLEEVILDYQKFGENIENICCIYPCVPFLKSKTLKDAYLQFNSKPALMPVCKYPVPIEWAMKIVDGVLEPNDRDSQNIRSQDIEPKYFDVGMFYFIKKEVLLNEKTLYAKGIQSFIMNEKEIQDIDTLEDWKMAELKYKILNNL